MCILRSLCVYYDLYVYTMIPMCILRSLCVYYDLYVYTMISMCILRSLCVYYDLYGCKVVSVIHLAYIGYADKGLLFRSLNHIPAAVYQRAQPGHRALEPQSAD